MGETHVLGPDAGERWLGFYERAGEPGPYHRPEYVTRLAGNFEHEIETAELFVYEGKSGIVYYPYLKRELKKAPMVNGADIALDGYTDIVSSWYYGGPVRSPESDPDITTEFVEAFEAHCRQDGIVAEFVRFDPYLHNHEDFERLDPAFNRETVPVDLTRSADDIWEGYEGRNQRAIKQGKETALVIEETTAPADVTAFHEIYTNAMEARDADPHYRFERSFFAELLGTDLFTLLVARYEDEVVGGFIVAHDDRIGHHYLSASSPDYWDMRVNNLLYHEVVMYMHEAGLERFDFQGGRQGVFNFKKGFSPDRGEFYIGKQIHLPDLYETCLSAAKQVGIDTETGYFPAYRVEQSN